MPKKTWISFSFVGYQYREFEVRALLVIAYRLVFSSIVVYISEGINKSSNANGSVASTLGGILTLGSRERPGENGLNITSFGSGIISIISSSGNFFSSASSAAFAFFLSFLSIAFAFFLPLSGVILSESSFSLSALSSFSIPSTISSSCISRLLICSQRSCTASSSLDVVLTGAFS